MSRKCSRKKKIDRAVDNVDFQLFLTQILYLNSKRVKIGGVQELSTSQAAKNLELTPTSISRASKQLEEMGLLHIKKEGVPQFYRFSHPITNQYPAMIELFTRKLDAIQLPEDAVLTPLPMDEVMLSRLVDTFFSRTSWTMLLYAENHSISVA